MSTRCEGASVESTYILPRIRAAERWHYWRSAFEDAAVVTFVVTLPCLTGLEVPARHLLGPVRRKALSCEIRLVANRAVNCSLDLPLKAFGFLNGTLNFI